MARPLIVFDLDGTLVDTAADLLGALNASLALEGLGPRPISEVGHLVGHGARAMVERGLILHGRALMPDLVERLVQGFLAHYAANIAVDSRPYPGVLAAMDRFDEAGWDMAVCTNKAEGLARQLIGGLGLTHRFKAITGGDTFSFKKPDARHLTETIARAGGSVDDSVMIGDSRTDIDAAKNAGIPVVAVSFGYSDMPVAQLGPTVVIDHFDALWDAVAGLRREMAA